MTISCKKCIKFTGYISRVVDIWWMFIKYSWCVPFGDLRRASPSFTYTSFLDYVEQAILKVSLKQSFVSFSEAFSSKSWLEIKVKSSRIIVENLLPSACLIWYKDSDDHMRFIWPVFSVKMKKTQCQMESKSQSSRLRQYILSCENIIFYFKYWFF